MLSSPKKTLYVSLSSGNHTGSPKALLDLSVNLDTNLFLPSLLVPEYGPLARDFERIGAEVHIKKSISLRKNNLFSYWSSVKYFKRFYNEHQIDLVHFNGIGWRESALVAARLARIPVMLHIHNACKTSDIKRNFNYFLADKVVTVSAAMIDDFKVYPAILKKTVCIHNGVDLKRFNTGLGKFRASLPVAGDSLVIGYVGQLSQRKGVDLLVKAAPAVLRRFPDALFLIAGADGIREEGYTESIKRLASDLGVSDRFLFIGKRDDVPEVMNACDLVVVPSRVEPFGKVIIEAMSCCKCVIASAVGGIPEIIQDGQNGLLVPPDNVVSLQEAVLRVLTDKDLRQNLAQSGKRTAGKNFSIEALVEKTQNLYTDLLLHKK